MGKQFQKNTRRKAAEYEKDILSYWKKNNIFEKSVNQRSDSNSFVFYDGPPFITGVPHHGTLLSSIVKDVIPRYKTMQGQRVERRWGWDCHGLPAEVFTEKKLGIKDKRDIGTKISIEEYIVTCRDNMVQTGDLWESTIDRIGRWVNFKGAYKTMDKEYMESVWWAFKELYEKGKIYEGEKVLMYCTRDATPISKAEVAMDNSYQDVTDPSVYVKFKLKGEEKYLLAWTTTPWTLPSNSAIAINRNISYSEVKVAEDVFILATELIERALTDEKHNVIDHEVIREFSGSELVGKEYEPLFDVEDVLKNNDNAFKIWHADFVHDEDGTGIAHESPAYGEEDYQLSRENDFPWIMSTDENGIFTLGEWVGQNVWDINKQIAKDLKEKDVVWKIDYIRHEYPHCHRCGTKLMYRAHPSWFMDIEGQRSEMLEENKSVNWFPERIKHGRSEKTIETAPDWNLSRDRFWATAMPVWKATDDEGKEHIKVVGSYEELKELSGVTLEDYHRPWIDDVTFEIDGLTYNRIEKVLDCWFESGSMPFAQFHYPFENKDTFKKSFPGDFIVEYVGQVRAWFYYMNAVNIGLFGEAAFKNVIVTGSVMGNDGRKLSKSLGNYTDPNIVMDEYSADALRFTLLNSPLLNGEDFTLKDKDVSDVARKLSMVWNMYDFFTLYADVDGWEWDGSLNDPSGDLDNSLDEWIVSRVHQLISDVEKATNNYDIPNAMKPILPFIDDASNWYVRRSRKRFWKSEDDSDKQQAYRTLHYILVQTAHILAPFTPFLSEELYRKLTDDESVHLNNWPKVGVVNTTLIQQMAFVREVINEGLSQRASAGIKVRQPLAAVSICDKEDLITNDFKDIISEELNVKKVETRAETAHPSVDQSYVESTGIKVLEPTVVLDLVITPELRSEGIVREAIRHVQNARKQAGLEVDDRIDLLLESESPEVNEAIHTHKEIIKNETLTVLFGESNADGYEQTAKINGLEIKIKLNKS